MNPVSGKLHGRGRIRYSCRNRLCNELTTAQSKKHEENRLISNASSIELNSNCTDNAFLGTRWFRAPRRAGGTSIAPSQGQQLVARTQQRPARCSSQKTYSKRIISMDR
jgi:hypothetical protein